MTGVQTCALPIFILHDRVLREIAIDPPATLTALGRISGIGENKLRRFGERLLALVKEV